MRSFFVISVAIAASIASHAAAQNTSGVSSPIVKPGEAAFGYRFAYSQHEDSADAWAHRLHVERAATDSLRLRVLGAFSQRAGGDLDFRSVGAEARWQLVRSADHGWDGGAILQIAVPTTRGHPDRVKFGLPASVDVTDKWQVRGVVYTGFEFGENARPGALLDLRAETTYEIADGVRLGPQWFSDLNTTARLGGFDRQGHQLGFILKGRLMKDLSYETGALFGVSEASPNADFRLFVSYAL